MKVRRKSDIVVVLYVFLTAVLWLLFLALSGLFDPSEIVSIATSPVFLFGLFFFVFLYFLSYRRLLFRKGTNNYKKMSLFATYFFLQGLLIPGTGLLSPRLPEGVHFCREMILNGWLIGFSLYLILGFLTLLSLVVFLSGTEYFTESFSFRAQMMIFNTSLAGAVIFLIAVLVVSISQEAFERNVRRALNNVSKMSLLTLKALDRGDPDGELVTEFKDIYREIKIGQRGYPYLIDTSGMVLLHPTYEGMNVKSLIDPVTGRRFIEEIISMKEGWIEYYWEKPGKEGYYKKIARFVYYRPRGYIVVFSVYKDELFSWLFAISRKVMIIALIFISLAYVAGIAFSGVQARALGKVLTGIERISQGDFSVRIEARGNDEISVIGRGINYLASNLQKKREEAERYSSLISRFYDEGLRLLESSSPEEAMERFRSALIGSLNLREVVFFMEKPEGLVSHLDVERLVKKGIVRIVEGKSICGGRDPGEEGGIIFPCEMELEGRPERGLLMPVVIEGKTRGVVFAVPKDDVLPGEAEKKLLGSFVTFLSSLTERLLYSRNLEALIEKGTRELELSQKKFKILYERASEGIFLYNLKEDRILDANSRFLEMMEMDEDDLKETDTLAFIHPDEREKVEKYTRKRLEGGYEAAPTSYTTVFISRKGKPIHVRLSLARLDDEFNYVVIVTDISELVRLQEQLEKANAELAEKAVRDPLTGAFNRRKLFDVLEACLKTVGEGRSISLIMADLDGFKEINDRYGHQVGDFLLRSVYRTFQNYVRDEDWIFRYGGDEFIILLPETDKEAGRIVAERLRIALEKKEHYYRRGAEGGSPLALVVTASFGVSSAPQDAREPEKLIDRADRAMYSAKKKGGNRICLYDTGVTGMSCS